MRQNNVNIFEYEEKRINDYETDNLSKKEIYEIETINTQIKKDQHLKNDILQVIYRKGRAVSLKASSYVGVIKTRNKTIQIIPKMARGENQNEYAKQAISNLLHMLSYTKRLNVKETKISSMKNVKDNFFEVLIYMYAKNLTDVVTKRLYKEYVSEEDNLTFLKGKINFGKHFKINVSDKSKFYLVFDEFKEDNPLNQILKYTTMLLTKSTNNVTNRKLLQNLNFLFADNTLKKIIPDDFSKLKLTRLNQEYEPIINLCKLFLTSGTLELSRGKIETFSFVIDMNQLFEEYVGEFIRKEFNKDFEEIILQDREKYLILNKVDKGISKGKLFQMRPDILIKNNGENYMVIDTKYKLLDLNTKKLGVSQQDLYQMFAYLKKYGCSNVILLYPKQENEPLVETDYFVEQDTAIKVRNIDLCRDIRAEKKELRDDLKRILN